MRLLALFAALALSAGSLHSQDTLRVLRHAPSDTASSADIITVTFDRPVAGRLDATTPAARILDVTPLIRGRVEWRDPITIRFVPDSPLVPGSRYTVTVDTAFRAVDGSRLGRRYEFSFRVPGPRLLGRSFGGNYSNQPETLPYGGKLKLLYSAPIDSALLASGTRLELSNCNGRRLTIAMRVLRQRPIVSDDPYRLLAASGWFRDTTANRFRRVVELEPETALPEDCAGVLVLPTTRDDAVNGSAERYAVRTAPRFALSAFDCSLNASCSMDNLTLTFSAAVKREDVRRYVHVTPTVPFELYGGDENSRWQLRLQLVARTVYTVTVDSALHAVDGRPITPPLRAELATGDYVPMVGYAGGNVTVARTGPQTIPVRHMNARTLRMLSYFIPESNSARALSFGAGEIAAQLAALAGEPDTAIITLDAALNVEGFTEVRIPSRHGSRGQELVALKFDVGTVIAPPAPPGQPGPVDKGIVTRVAGGFYSASPYTLVQVSDLALHSKAGADESTVLVTSLANGRPRPRATVRYLDPDGAPIAESVTDSIGVATIRQSRARDTTPSRRLPLARQPSRRANLIEAVVDGDRLILPLPDRTMGYGFLDPLEPSRLGGRREDAPEMAATIFADRGIYRPGEMLYLKGVLRTGTLGALTVPERQPVRLTLTYRRVEWDSDEDVVIRDTVLMTSDFGTISDSVRLRQGLALGRYVARIDVGGPDNWRAVSSEELRVAEYRAPEFLVETTGDSATLSAGDTARISVAARYLFGGPMGRADVRWQATLREIMPWEIHIPGAEGWTVGEWNWWTRDRAPPPNGVASSDTLDAGGRMTLRIPIAELRPSRPGRLDVNVAVSDINRQVVTSSASVAVSPARLYVLARKAGKGWFWTAREPVRVEIRTVRPDGSATTGAAVVATVVRRQPRWIADDVAWTDTTLQTDTVQSALAATPISFTPPTGGLYEIRLTAGDGRGGTARTTLSGYAMDAGRGPGEGDSYHLPLVASQREAAIGDVVQVAFNSPFAEADAWVTVEREHVLETRRLTVRRGSNVVPLLLTAAHIPNIFVSVMLLAHRPPGAARPDSATELLRVGYAEVLVKTQPKRLAIAVRPAAAEYRPGDSTAVRVTVTDAAKRGVRSEVTLWAVDEGVLALTDYTTPDLLARLYQPRGIGAPLYSSLPALVVSEVRSAYYSSLELSLRGRVAGLSAQVVTNAPADAPVAMRKEFRTTAFYIASGRTDDSGRVLLRARVPDNITTYRLMAVAVGATDLFGSGDTTMLVTRPLVARPSLPRFVRAADTLRAGAVVNARDGLVHEVSVDAAAEGLTVQGAARRVVTLERGRGAEARFDLTVPARDVAPDTVVLRLRASDQANADAVETRLPVEPDFHPRTHTSIGALRERAEVTIDLPGDIDPARSSFTLRIGTSPLVPMLAAFDWLRIYPYECTEQITSRGRALVAIWRATGDSARSALGGDPRSAVQQLADQLARRQRSDGGFRYWDDHDWTTPWLTAYAGMFLLDARDQGIVVDHGVLERAAGYLKRALDTPADTGGMNRVERRSRRLALGNRVAVLDYLRRLGEPAVAAENAMLQLAPRMTWEDRLRLAELLAPRRDAAARARALVDAAWRTVIVAGRRVDLPDSSHTDREFPSRIAPAARLLSASLALRPEHPLLGGLIETVLQQGRAERGWAWNTQDYASMVMAMAALSGDRGPAGVVTVTGGGRTLISRTTAGADSAAATPLTGLLERAPNGAMRLRLALTARGSGALYYGVSVVETPSRAPVKPDIQGIVIERWYERFDTGQPVTAVREGDLVRVRIRVTVPADREFVAVEDPLPAGLEPVDLSLNTSRTLQPFVTPVSTRQRDDDADAEDRGGWQSWLYGRWDDGWWSPWEHTAIHDDKVVYFARMLWPGSYTASYVARATTTGSFVRPPAHAEEMYNPALQGRSDGGRFTVTEKQH